MKFRILTSAFAFLLVAFGTPAHSAYSDKYVLSVVVPKIKGVTKFRALAAFGEPSKRAELGSGVELFIYGEDPK